MFIPIFVLYIYIYVLYIYIYCDKREILSTTFWFIGNYYVNITRKNIVMTT